jgi:hypothetical protein
MQGSLGEIERPILNVIGSSVTASRGGGRGKGARAAAVPAPKVASVHDGVTHPLLGGIRQDTVGMNEQNQLNDAEDEEQNEEYAQDKLHLRLPARIPSEVSPA